MENSNKDNEERIASTSSRPRYPPGYRFVPTDSTLILEKKVNNELIPIEEISEVKLYEHPPQYLAANYPYLGFGDWYFFTPRDRKYPNGNRPSRSIGELGFWKTTGSDIPIMSSRDEKVGFKRSLVYHEFKGEGNDRIKVKSEWSMHEYRLNAPSKAPNSTTKDMKLDDWVLCRIRRKNGKSCMKEILDAEEDDDVEKVVLNENRIECIPDQAEPLNIMYNTNNNNNGSPIDQDFIGPLVDNNNLYSQNHEVYELNFGYLGHQESTSYPTACNYYPADMSCDFQDHCFNDETLYQYMSDIPSHGLLDDLPSLNGNYFMQFDDHLIDNPCSLHAPSNAPDAPSTEETKPSDEITKVKRK